MCICCNLLTLYILLLFFPGILASTTLLTTAISSMLYSSSDVSSISSLAALNAHSSINRIGTTTTHLNSRISLTESTHATTQSRIVITASEIATQGHRSQDSIILVETMQVAAGQYYYYTITSCKTD